jgi:hypothetical protein
MHWWSIFFQLSSSQWMCVFWFRDARTQVYRWFRGVKTSIYRMQISFPRMMVSITKSERPLAGLAYPGAVEHINAARNMDYMVHCAARESKVDCAWQVRFPLNFWYPLVFLFFFFCSSYSPTSRDEGAVGVGGVVWGLFRRPQFLLELLFPFSSPLPRNLCIHKL